MTLPLGSTLISSPLSIAGLTAAAGLLGYLLLKPKKPIIGECCPGQSAGFLPQDVNYAAKGKMEDIQGTPAYVVGEGPKAVVMVHDIFGLYSGRHKQLADEIASRGFLVVVPDFFAGADGGLFGKEELGYGRMSTLLKFLWAMLSGQRKSFQRQHPWNPTCQKVWIEQIEPWLDRQGCSSTGVVSFCWGAYVALHAAGLRTTGLKPTMPVTANVLFHPSFAGIAGAFNEDQEALVKAAATVPTSVYSTSMEPKGWQPGGQASQWMKDANADGVVVWQQVNQMHGVMTRGDMKADLQLAEDIQRFVEETVTFLKKHVQ